MSSLAIFSPTEIVSPYTTIVTDKFIQKPEIKPNGIEVCSYCFISSQRSSISNDWCGAEDIADYSEELRKF